MTTIKGLKAVLKEKVMFRMLVHRVPLEAALKTRGIQNGRMLSERNLKVSGTAVPMCLKTSQGGRRAAWMNRELLPELREERRVYDLWKKERNSGRGQGFH